MRYWFWWNVYGYRHIHWENLALYLAARCPRWIRYWIVVDSFAKATIANNKTPNETGFDDVIAICK